MIQLFDIKTRTPGFRFLSTPKKSLPKSLTQKKSLQNFKPKKSPQIANFKPKKGLRTSPSLIYLSTPPGASRLRRELRTTEELAQIFLFIVYKEKIICIHHKQRKNKQTNRESVILIRPLLILRLNYA